MASILGAHSFIYIARFNVGGYPVKKSTGQRTERGWFLANSQQGTEALTPITQKIINFPTITIVNLESDSPPVKSSHLNVIIADNLRATS